MSTPINSHSYGDLTAPIRGMRVTNIQPFTYRDGLTFLEVLEKTRVAISEVIEYASQFGGEAEKTIGEMNGKIEMLVKSVSDIVNAQTEANDEKIAVVNQKIGEINSLIEEFKKKLIANAFTTDSNKVETLTMSGERVEMPTLAAFETLKNTSEENVSNLTRTISENIQTESQTRAQELNAKAVELTRLISEAKDSLSVLIDTEKGERDRGDSDRYTKQEADRRFMAAELRSAVFVGSSNATTQTRWTSDLCARFQWDHHNHCIGGGAFTSVEHASFLQQAKNAANSLSPSEREKVGYLFVCDMLNDIRAQNNVREKARQFFIYVREKFPNARIIILPVILNQSSLNESIQVAQSVTNRIEEVSLEGLPYGVEVIQGTHTWFFNEGSDSNVTDMPGEVHLTPSGYQRVYYYVSTYINGGYTWRDYGWEPLHNYSQPNLERNYNYLNIARYQNFVTIRGSFRTGGGQISFDSVMMNVPGYCRPYASVVFPVYGRNRETKVLYINNKGQIANRDILKENETYDVDFTYRIW